MSLSNKMIGMEFGTLLFFDQNVTLWAPTSWRHPNRFDLQYLERQKLNILSSENAGDMNCLAHFIFNAFKLRSDRLTPPE